MKVSLTKFRLTAMQIGKNDKVVPVLNKLSTTPSRYMED
jgi:hypothetical protein